MNVTLSDEEAVVTVDALRLRATHMDEQVDAFSNLPMTVGWIKETIANMTSVADRIEAAKEAEWLDRKAEYDAFQTADLTARLNGR
jgi:hypothetical protein